ncbi:MAG: glycosyltransferase family 39 protein [Arcobacteraceae bacterium]|jgi:hypothetical protein|nr:glycosyltransferase family 39 protein [Arcobacteraceae bacterium]
MKFIQFNKYNLTFLALLIVHIALLLYMVNDFSIAYKELAIFQNKTGLVGLLSHIFADRFGAEIVWIKLPFIIFYSLSAIVLYLLTDDYFKYQKDRVLAVAIFMILPGVNSAALLLNESIIVVFFTLLYLYLYKKTEKENYLLLFIFLFIDNSFAILYLALFFYSLKKRDDLLLFVSLILFGLSMSFYGFEIGGKPRGYFVDTFGIYASIFSPLLFLYFFYAIYRFGIKFERDMYWYLASTALVLSFVFSLRQKIYIEDFAPFVVVAIPVMLKLIMHSIRVRLREHQGNYLFLGYLLLFSLIFNFGIFLFNKSLYLIVENPKKHFAYDYHIAKELAIKLKSLGIERIYVKDDELRARLRFYGIKNDGRYKLVQTSLNDKKCDIKIEYFGKSVAKYDIAKR